MRLSTEDQVVAYDCLLRGLVKLESMMSSREAEEVVVLLRQAAQREGPAWQALAEAVHEVVVSAAHDEALDMNRRNQ